MVDRILHTCPEVSILVTSREILGVMGEVPFLVPPMSLPVDQPIASTELLRKFDAVQLFVERARVSLHDFELTKENAPLVVEIVRRLDGIPLAIELAAARLRLLGLEQIARRLDDVFRLLTGGSRTVLPRHQTLRASIDWSYDLLSEAERILLRRLSVFMDSWQLRAAEVICSETPDSEQFIHPDMILDLHAELVDKSFIYPITSADGVNRYRMLGPVRQYAGEKLVDEKEARLLRTRHLAYYLEMAETLEPKLRGREQVLTFDLLERELSNLRLALEWALHTNVEDELRLASALMWFWHIRFHWSEAIEWLQRGLAKEEEIRQASTLTNQSTITQTQERSGNQILRAKALSALGFHQSICGQEWSSAGAGREAGKEEWDKARKVMEESLGVFREAGSECRGELAFTLRWLSPVVGNPEYASEALELCREINDQVGIFESLYFVGTFEPDPARRTELHKEQLSVAETFEDEDLIATAMMILGNDSFVASDYDQACAFYLKSQEHYHKVGNSVTAALGLLDYAVSCLFSGKYQQAAQPLEQGLEIYREVGHTRRFLFGSNIKYRLAVAQGDYEMASLIIQEEQALNQQVGNPEIDAIVSFQQSRLARLQGEIQQATQQLQDSLEIARKNDYPDLIILAFNEMGNLASLEGDLSRADSLLRQCFHPGIVKIDSYLVGYPLASLAGLAVKKGETSRAARLFGAASHF
jgi:predicted ATPase